METKLLHLAYFAVINLLIVLAGYFFLKRRLLLPGWLLLILSIRGCAPGFFARWTGDQDAGAYRDNLYRD